MLVDRLLATAIQASQPYGSQIADRDTTFVLLPNALDLQGHHENPQCDHNGLQRPSRKGILLNYADPQDSCPNAIS